MPCLIIVGHPSAGKTTLVELLKERALLHDAIDEVVVLNEESECGCIENDDGEHQPNGAASTKEKGHAVTTKQELYETSISEKQTRGALKAAFDRAVKKASGNQSNSRRLVILDSMNYIKGFRYELHCISKAAGDKHGILWVLNQLSVVQQWNKNYSPALLRELISRFEPPDSRNRWDNPLFTIDVAATTSSSLFMGGNGSTKNVSSKNEVLEHSVYNMHSLGEAFGSLGASEQTRKIDSASALVDQPQSVSSSNTTKAPKKSAFSRRKKASAPSKIEAKPTYKQTSSNFIIDTSILDSPAIDVSAATKEDVQRTDPPSVRPMAPETEQEVNYKPLEEQIDDILDTFLLKTRNLKEGMSTRQYE